MKEFYKEAIAEMERYLSNANFYSKKEFGRMVGLEWMSSKREMIANLERKIREYEEKLNAQ